MLMGEKKEERDYHVVSRDFKIEFWEWRKRRIRFIKLEKNR